MTAADVAEWLSGKYGEAAVETALDVSTSALSAALATVLNSPDTSRQNPQSCTCRGARPEHSLRAPRDNARGTTSASTRSRRKSSTKRGGYVKLSTDVTSAGQN